MIVVDEVVPGGPASGLLEPGDIVIRIDGELVTAFVPIEALLDDRVGGVVSLEVERGGQPTKLELQVADLHAITPDAYLEVGGGVLNLLSYQQARNRSVPVRGIFVADAGYMLSRDRVPRGAVITAVDGKPVSTLSELGDALSEIPEGSRVPLRYFLLANPRTSSVVVIRMSRRWFDLKLCTRDDDTGRWPCRRFPEPPPAEPQLPTTTNLSASGERALQVLAPSLVAVDYDIPYRLDGVHGDRFEGSGLIVDTERGLVVVDRETVPIAIGDLTITFGGSVEVPGELVYLHPEHNIAVIAYDPALIGDTPVKAAELRARELEPGDDVWLVGMSTLQRLVSRETRVSRRGPLALPLPHPPRFRETNIEVVELEGGTATVGGVLADRKGRVLALWASFSQGSGSGITSRFAGIPIERVIDVIEPLREGRPVARRSLEIELLPLTLAAARHRGLTDEQARRLEAHDPEGRSVLSVVSRTAGTAAAALLQEGDLLLAIDGEPVSRFAEVERASQRQTVRLTVLRNRMPMEVDVETALLSGVGTERALVWAGALLQESIRALAAQRGIAREGVYVARYWFGSPANRYGLRATQRIIAVNGVETPDLDTFASVVGGVPDRGAVRLKTLELDGRVDVITLKTDLEYWPTSELLRGASGWTRNPLDVSDHGSTADGDELR
jgi:S1-C subfamily serine protease